jgi:hypothetical protein
MVSSALPPHMHGRMISRGMMVTSQVCEAVKQIPPSLLGCSTCSCASSQHAWVVGDQLPVHVVGLRALIWHTYFLFTTTTTTTTTTTHTHTHTHIV